MSKSGLDKIEKIKVENGIFVNLDEVKKQFFDKYSDLDFSWIEELYGRDYNQFNEWYESRITQEREAVIEEIIKNVGILRQLLNEERIKDADRFIDNQYIIDILGIKDPLSEIERRKNGKNSARRHLANTRE